MDNKPSKYKAPFPYFGSKSIIAGEVWKRFGKVHNYIEPFFGSGAVLLARPLPFSGKEICNDKDGMVSNFWRAVAHDPEKVAHYADWPINENDKHARHIWLVNRKDSLQTKLEGDPNYYNAKIAGWWVWGLCLHIGGGFCSGEGGWRIIDGELTRGNNEEDSPTIDRSRQQTIGNRGVAKAVTRSRQHLKGNRGVAKAVTRSRQYMVSRQGIIKTITEEWGVNRSVINIGAKRGVLRSSERGNSEGAGLGNGTIYEWFDALCGRMKSVLICCGEWYRVCGGKRGDALAAMLSGGPTCGVFLDPPYSFDAGRDMNLYRYESGSVAYAVREWCLKYGDDSRFRIALCGYESEHNMPDSWECLEWKGTGGMSNMAKKKTRAKDNAIRERIWFSPHCLKAKDRLPLLKMLDK
jgi:hypothetical protein